ncbi:Type 1 phosphatases regulator ypi1 [Polyrhizophydium stewartii]|uniref:Type 1 phosphatases regulator n=1 Tax=Polyrhizophydium stewartii TaxID=2732419 RepID=A0ABR4MZU1_9FUNG
MSDAVASSQSPPPGQRGQSTRLAQRRAEPSATVTQTVTAPEEAVAEPGPVTVGVLRLEGGEPRERRVAWDTSVVDNELLGRKKSKVCCIYHRPHRPDGSSSSDESSSDDDDPSKPNAYERQPNYGRRRRGKKPHHAHDHDGPCSHDHDHDHDRQEMA